MVHMEGLGRTPVSADDPAGTDPRESPYYEAMQTEVARLGSLAGAGSVNWHEVAQNAAVILERQAKDIPAAAYLGIALAETQGIYGLRVGARVLADVLELWWDVCFPPLKRLRARGNMVQWWRERAMIILERPQEPVSPQEHEDLTTAITTLDSAVSHRLPDAPPMYDLLEAVRRLPVTDPSLTATPGSLSSAAPAEIAASAEQDYPIATQTTSPAATLSDSPSPEQASQAETLDAARDQLLAAARRMVDLASAESAPTGLLAWRAFYMSLWGKLRHCPPEEDGVTALPPPDAAGMSSCRSMLDMGDVQAAVTALLRFLPSCPFYLEAQHHLHTALTRCGPEYTEALMVLRQETLALLHRLPGVERLRFNDGTPFVSESGRVWLLTLGNTVPSGQDHATGAAPTPSPISKDDDCAQAIHDADELLARQQPRQALACLHAAARRAGQEGAIRLLLQVRQLELLNSLEQWKLATALAEVVLAELDRRQLDDWQPTLSFRALSAICSAWRGHGQERGEAEIRRIMPRLAALDLPACADL